MHARIIVALGLLLLAGCSIDFHRHGRGGDGGALDGDTPDGLPPLTDGDVDSAPPLPSPVPWSPHTGWDSGSVHAGTAIAQHPLRPTFRWHAVSGATQYRFELDVSTAFGAPVVDETTSDTSYTPDEPLDVLRVPFIGNAAGRRLFFRVTACGTAGCSAPSPASYVDVGRLPDDLDGDGYSDLFVGAPGDPAGGRGWLFRGSPSGIALPGGLLAVYAAPSDFGASAAVLDANGDGFTDLVVTAPALNELRYFRGEHASMPALAEAFSVPFEAVGGPVQGVGDLDGDGFDDLAVGLPNHASGGTNAGVVRVYYGSAAGLSETRIAVLPAPAPQPGAKFGEMIASRGDLDADGYSDLAIGSPFHDGLRGRIDVFRGGPGGVSRTPSWTLTAASGGLFGPAALGDVDGDGVDDLIGGATYVDDVDDGRVFVHLGGAAGLSVTPAFELPCPSDSAGYASFGVAIGAGDLDGDGRADLVVGASHFTGAATRDGRAFGYRGPLAAGAAPTVEYHHPGDPSNADLDARFAERLFLYADFDGDGFRDLAIAARLAGPPGPYSDRGSVFLHHGGPGALEAGARVTPTLRIDHPASTADAQFGAAIARVLSLLPRRTALL